MDSGTSFPAPPSRGPRCAHASTGPAPAPSRSGPSRSCSPPRRSSPGAAATTGRCSPSGDETGAARAGGHRRLRRGSRRRCRREIDRVVAEGRTAAGLRPHAGSRPGRRPRPVRGLRGPALLPRLGLDRPHPGAGAGAHGRRRRTARPRAPATATEHRRPRALAALRQRRPLTPAAPRRRRARRADPGRPLGRQGLAAAPRDPGRAAAGRLPRAPPRGPRRGRRRRPAHAARAARRHRRRRPAAGQALARLPEQGHRPRPAHVAEQHRTYWCGPTSMQMIAWGWSGRPAHARATGPTELGTTTSGTVDHRHGPRGQPAHRLGQARATPARTSRSTSATGRFQQWMLLMMRHIVDYRAPVILHPILLKQFYPYLDDDGSGHFQVGRGYDRSATASRRCSATSSRGTSSASTPTSRSSTGCSGATPTSATARTRPTSSTISASDAPYDRSVAVAAGAALLVARRPAGCGGHECGADGRRGPGRRPARRTSPSSSRAHRDALGRRPPGVDGPTAAVSRRPPGGRSRPASDLLDWTAGARLDHGRGHASAAAGPSRVDRRRRRGPPRAGAHPRDRSRPAAAPQITDALLDGTLRARRPPGPPAQHARRRPTLVDLATGEEDHARRHLDAPTIVGGTWALGPRPPRCTPPPGRPRLLRGVRSTSRPGQPRARLVRPAAPRVHAAPRSPTPATPDADLRRPPTRRCRTAVRLTGATT